MKKPYKIALGIIVILLVAGGVYYALNRPVEAETMTIEKRDFLQEVSADGVVTGVRDYSVSSLVGGKVLSVVEENSYVNQGDLVLEVDSSDFRYKIDELEAQKQSNEAQKKVNSPTLYESQIKQIDVGLKQLELEEETAAKDLADAKTLYESGAIPKKQLDDANTKLDTIKNQIQAKKEERNLVYETAQPKDGVDQLYTANNQAIDQNIKSLQKKIEDSKVYSPISGRVVMSAASKGETVPQGVEVAKITGGEGEKIIESDVHSDDVVRIGIGTQVKITQKTSGDDLYGKGEVESINDFATDSISNLGISEKKVKVKVKITDDSALKLSENYEVKLDYLVDKDQDTIVVPNIAIFKDQDKDYVFTVKKGKATKTQVTIGKKTSSESQIIEGIKPGDIVIINSDNEEIKDGKRIKTVEKTKQR